MQKRMFYGLVLVAWGILTVAFTYVDSKQAKPHKPKFTYGQCFAKMGLREPWDLEVAGRVYSRGYLKYLVMYADEANRVTLAPKSSWEEDIQEFDKKNQVVPCPNS